VHITTKIFVILNLIACLILSQYVWISLAENVAWRERYETERDARHVDKDRLEGAYARLLSERRSNQNSASQKSAEVAALNATKQALETWKLEAELVAQEAADIANQLIAAVQPFQEISAGYNNDVVATLHATVESLSQRKSNIAQDRGEELLRVAQAHNSYAERAEAYRRLEYQQFLLQEEYEARLDTNARYRWLRPDIQKELGDNGPVIFANINWVVGNAVQLNRGRRHGVELYQKYTVMRAGSTIAVINVVDIQNETAEAVIVDLVDRNVTPRQGDEAVTRLFMSRLSRR
jgi:hypothetical protein